MILITGPTGSGKTVSLYTALHLLNVENRNISTVEEPVEIFLEGVNQVNVNFKIGLDFATALRAFLRQDPNVIMVGEIRDLETVEIAVKAAQTGHKVLSTLHTNSAIDTLTRLKNLGIPNFNIATALNLVIAQRLVRKLCSHCKQQITLSSESLLEIGFKQSDITPNLAIFQAAGCSQCKDGYKGRIGIYECLKISPELSDLILQDAPNNTILNQAEKQGFISLKRA